MKILVNGMVLNVILNKNKDIKTNKYVKNIDKMDNPLIGNREENYKFFYCASGSAILSMIILLIITGYTAHISGTATELIRDMTVVTNDINELLPEAKEGLKLIKQICVGENFTKKFGNVCDSDWHYHNKTYHDHEHDHHHLE